MPYINFAAVKEAVSIEAAAQLLNLDVKQSANQLRGACPACQSDDDRSLAITPNKAVFFCHSGKVGGDCISLVGHILGLSMKDAAEWLQDTLPQQERSRTVPTKPEGGKQPAPNSNEQPKVGLKPTSSPIFDAKLFAAKLVYSDEVKTLGLTEQDAERFGVGFYRGRTYFPVRDANGFIAGFVGYSKGELKTPPSWLDAPNDKVVQFKRPA